MRRRFFFFLLSWQDLERTREILSTEGLVCAARKFSSFLGVRDGSLVVSVSVSVLAASLVRRFDPYSSLFPVWNGFDVSFSFYDRILLVCIFVWPLSCGVVSPFEDFLTHVTLFFRHRESCFFKMLAAPMSLNSGPAMTPSKSWPYFDPEYDTMSSIIDPPK